MGIILILAFIIVCIIGFGIGTVIGKIYYR